MAEYIKAGMATLSVVLLVSGVVLFPHIAMPIIPFLFGLGVLSLLYIMFLNMFRGH